MNKSELLKNLGEGSMRVTFTKKDGTERAMICTRSLSLIPADHQSKAVTEAVTEEMDNIRVFDIEAQGWRSFNFSSMKA